MTRSKAEGLDSRSRWVPDRLTVANKRVYGPASWNLNGNMPASSITPDIERFLSAFVHSYEQMESLLVLRRDAVREWTPQELADELGVSSQAAEEALQHLTSVGIVDASASAQHASVRYHGPQEAFRSLVDALAYAFEHHKVDVITVMNRNAVERLRTDALRAFADAFVLRRRGG